MYGILSIGPANKTLTQHLIKSNADLRAFVCLGGLITSLEKKEKLSR